MNGAATRDKKRAPRASMLAAAQSGLEHVNSGEPTRGNRWLTPPELESVNPGRGAFGGAIVQEPGSFAMGTAGFEKVLARQAEVAQQMVV